MKPVVMFTILAATMFTGCSDATLFGGNIALAFAPIAMLLMTINFKKF